MTQIGRSSAVGTSTWSAFRVDSFRWLYASNVAFFLAMNGQSVLRGWLAFELTHSELALGKIAAAVAIPMLLVAPLGGVVADRFERRSLIFTGQLVVMVSESVVLGLMWADRLEFWHLCTATFCMGCVFPLIMPARQAIVANIVGRAGLTNATALNMSAINATRVAGLFSGFLIEPFGIQYAYCAGVALYLIALLCVLRVARQRPSVTSATGTTTLWVQLGEGFRYLSSTPLVFLLLLFGLIPMFLAMPFQQLLVSFAERVWKVGSQGFTLLSATAGLGGLAGSMYVARRAHDPRRMRLMLVSMCVFGGFLILFAATPFFVAALPLVFVASAASSVFGALNNTAIQLLIPDRVRGRVSSFLMMSFSLPLLGTLPVGQLAERFGPSLAIQVAAGLAVLSVLAFYAASPMLRGLDHQVTQALAAPEDSEVSPREESALARPEPSVRLEPTS